MNRVTEVTHKTRAREGVLALSKAQKGVGGAENDELAEITDLRKRRAARKVLDHLRANAGTLTLSNYTGAMIGLGSYYGIRGAAASLLRIGLVEIVPAQRGRDGVRLARNKDSARTAVERGGAAMSYAASISIKSAKSTKKQNLPKPNFSCVSPGHAPPESTPEANAVPPLRNRSKLSKNGRTLTTWMVCTCSAYPWPHRPAGGLCRWPHPPTERFPHPAGTRSKLHPRRRSRGRLVILNGVIIKATGRYARLKEIQQAKSAARGVQPQQQRMPATAGKDRQ